MPSFAESGDYTFFLDAKSTGFLPLSGGAMTGPLVLAADPVQANQAATKFYVDRTLGGFLPLTGGTMSGAITGLAPSTALPTGASVARTLAARFADFANVLDFGADPTGVADSAPAFNAAAAATTPSGGLRTVYAPAGTYKLRSTITLGSVNYAQELSGDGWATILDVNSDFSASATSVINATAVSASGTRSSIRNLRINFHQPPDLITTTTAAAIAGATTITVASTAGIVVGMFVASQSNNNSIQCLSAQPTTVSSIAGNVITLSLPTTGAVGNGDTIGFAVTRANWKTLAAGGSSSAAGSGGIKYPWAIYAVNAFHIDKVLITGGWDGVHIRGSGFAIGQLDVEAWDVGLDVDQCYNFPQIDSYMCYTLGTGQSRLASSGAYYDGATVAANFGEVDGLACRSLQTWVGVVNLTSAWSWGSFDTLMLDGDNANLIVSSVGGAFTQIGNCYSSKSAHAIGNPIAVGGGTVIISSFEMTSARQGPGILISGGALHVMGGYIWSGNNVGTPPMISQGAGSLFLSNLRFDAGVPGANFSYLTQTSGSVHISNCSFISAPSSGGVAFSLADNAQNMVQGVALNGWAFTLPGPFGNYQNSAINGRPIGTTTPAAGAFTTLSTSGAATFGSTVTLAADPTVALGAVTKQYTDRAIYYPPGDGTSLQAPGSSFSVFTGGGYNSAFGYNAMPAVTSAASLNCAFGAQSGQFLTNGQQNTLLGVSAGQHITTGQENTAIGLAALQANVTGFRAVAVGVSALGASTASDNTALGFQAGKSITTGAANLMLGPVAQATLTTGSNNIYISGTSIDAATAGESATFRLGSRNDTGLLMRATGITNAIPALFLDWMPLTTTYATDAAAAAGGVAVGQLYRNGSIVQIRVA
jgi:hypothetical protein